jgi:hypothetical protein
MAHGVVTIDLHEIKTGDGVRLRDKNGNEATGPVTAHQLSMTVHIFGKTVEFARWSSKAGRTKTGDWIVATGLKVIGHQPAMF